MTVKQGALKGCQSTWLAEVVATRGPLMVYLALPPQEGELEQNTADTLNLQLACPRTKSRDVDIVTEQTAASVLFVYYAITCSAPA